MSSAAHNFHAPWRPGVYAIRNVTDGCVYVGGSVCMSARASHHIWHLIRGLHSNERLQAAWNELGPASFVFEVLEEVGETASLHLREQVHIDRLQAADNIHGYNISPTAEFVTHPAATRAKMAIAGAARTTSPETRQRQSEYARSHRTAEHSEKTTTHLRNKSPEHLAKMGAAHRGKVISEAQRLKQSLATKGRKQSPEHIANRTAARMEKLRAAKAEAA